MLQQNRELPCSEVPGHLPCRDHCVEYLSRDVGSPGVAGGGIPAGRKVCMSQLLKCKQDSRRCHLGGLRTDASAEVKECRSLLPLPPRR